MASFLFGKGRLTYTIPNLIILSDNKPLATGSKTDYNKLNLGPSAKK